MRECTKKISPQIIKNSSNAVSANASRYIFVSKKATLDDTKCKCTRHFFAVLSLFSLAPRNGEKLQHGTEATTFNESMAKQCSILEHLI